MESNENALSLPFPDISERRREIFERTKAKYAVVGIALGDPEYLALISKWIDGAIAMSDAAAQWDKVKKGRGKCTRQNPSNPFYGPVENLPEMTQAQILAEIAKLAE